MERSNVNPNETRIKIKTFGGKSGIDYENYVEYSAYDIQYFYRNLYKYIVASVYIQKEIGLSGSYENLLDVGAGTGAFSIAWLTVASNLKNKMPKAVILNDRSEFQAILSTHVLDHLQKNTNIFNNNRFVTAPLIKDFRRGLHVRNSLLLLGYVLPGKIIDPDLISSISSDCLFVDYNTTLNDVERLISFENNVYHRATIHSKIPGNHLTYIKSPTVDTKLLFRKKDTSLAGNVKSQENNANV